MSVEIEKLTTSAGSPAATALLCTSDAANEVVKPTFLPLGVAWYAEMSFGKTLVGIEYATIEREEPAAAAPVTTRAASNDSRAIERRIGENLSYRITGDREANASYKHMSNPEAPERPPCGGLSDTS